MVVTLPILVALGLLLLVSASISATEAAILSVNKVRLRHLAESGHPAAKLTFELLTQLDRVIGTILVVNNVANIALSTLISWVAVVVFGPEHGLLIATVAATLLILLIGEVTPKMFAATHPEPVVFAMVWPLRVLMVVFYPFSVFVSWVARSILRLMGIPMRRRSPLVTEEEIKVMIQMGREAGVLAEHELRILHRTFEFSDVTVRQAMIPREQIAAIETGSTPEQLLDVIVEEGHSRIPVYKSSLDQIAGVIYARDVLALVRHGTLVVLADLIRPLRVVPEQKRLAELLTDFQRDKQQIAVVQNTKGATIGLITIEDVLEELVGEIHEELPGRR